MSNQISNQAQISANAAVRGILSIANAEGFNPHAIPHLDKYEMHLFKRDGKFVLGYEFPFSDGIEFYSDGKVFHQKNMTDEYQYLEKMFFDELALYKAKFRKCVK